MGILNVTPDSFSDGGLWADPEQAIEHGLRLVAAGADVVDVGGESTRPGADPVDEAVELARVVPVVEALAPRVRVSVDTTKAVVAEAAAAAGATLLNDVSASLERVAADLDLGWIAMHCQGTPATMQIDPTYHDVVGEVCDFLARRLDAGQAAGIEEVWIDPGIGFGKTLQHNLTLLARLDRLVELGAPVVVGTSRKAFLGVLTARSDGVDEPTPTDDRLEATLATVTWAAHCGVGMVRVHDVAACRDAVRVVAA